MSVEIVSQVQSVKIAVGLQIWRGRNPDRFAEQQWLRNLNNFKHSSRDVMLASRLFNSSSAIIFYRIPKEPPPRRTSMMGSGWEYYTTFYGDFQDPI